MHKCVDCAHCDSGRLLCTPDNLLCRPQYELTFTDLISEGVCDFFETKEQYAKRKEKHDPTIKNTGISS